MSADNRPLDLGKIDFEGNRRRLRRRLVIWSSPVTVVLFLFAVWLIMPAAATYQAQVAIDDSHYDTAGIWTGLLGTNNIFEPYIKAFNQATVFTHQQRFDEAIDQFTRSIALAPNEKVCHIRNQLVLSIELAGDASVHGDKQKAITYYTRALTEISANRSCFEGTDHETRIAKKLAEAINELKAELFKESDETAETVQTRNDPPSDNQLQILQTLQQQGEQARLENKSTKGLNGRFTSKPW